jgi:hypothetical protein
MKYLFTETWLLPLIPPEGGAFPYWSWGCEGPHSPYYSYTWDSGNKRYTEITVDPGDSLIIRFESDTTYLGENILDSYNYTLSVEGSPPKLAMGFAQVDDAVPVRIVTLYLDLVPYPFTKFPICPVTAEGDYTQISYTEEAPYTVSIFKVPPLQRKYIYINPGGLLGNISAWKYLLFPPLKDLFPGLLPHQL